MSNGSLETRVTALEAQMQEIRELLQETAQQQKATQQQFQNFLAEWSRIHAHDAERLARMEAGIDANRAAIERLTRNAESDRTDNRTTRDRINVLIERVEQSLDQQ